MLTPESATGLGTDPSQPEADPSFGGLRRNLIPETENNIMALDAHKK